MECVVRQQIPKKGLMEVSMKKFRILIRSMLCLGILFFLGAGSNVKAAEPEADTRPDYVIYVNRALNCITIKQQNADGTQTPVKSMVCSCGRGGYETPEGTFRTSDCYVWRQMVDGTYGRYAVRFNGKILIHSVPYLAMAPDTLEWEEYNKLGESASLGCVRVSVEDAKWIYDNCKRGTTVVVYSDGGNPGDLGKPEAAKIGGDLPYRGWDPTDADINNPWRTDAGGEEYVPFLGTIDEFDYVAYADRYQDLKDAFGYDRDSLYKHYITYGIHERRIY